MYERMLASDASYNGRFYTGVLTTGVYCLPSCGARKPKRQNVKFFFSAEDAVAFGLRACKRCRPEAFGLHLEEQALERFVADLRVRPSSVKNAEDLGVKLKRGTSKLNEDFRRHFHATPAAVLTRARIDWSRKALVAGDAPIGEIAVDAGFESLSTFYDNFRRASGLAPQEYRSLRTATCFVVPLPDGFDVSRWVRYLKRDTESVSERETEAGAFQFAVRLEGRPTCVTISIRDGSVRCNVEKGLGVAAHHWLIRKLGLQQDVRTFESLDLPEVRKLLVRGRALRIPQTGSVWEGLVWSIVGQQVNIRFAATLKRHLTELAGDRLENGMVCLPSMERVAEMEVVDLLPHQFSAKKAEYLIDAARMAARGELPLEELPDMPATKVERTLLAMRGIGPWSANYLMMRACGFMDCTPIGDTGLTSGLQRLFELELRPDAAKTVDLMRRFAPHRSLATYHIWNSLSEDI